MNNATHLIVSDSGLMGNIHQNANPFLAAAYVVSIGDAFYFAYFPIEACAAGPFAEIIWQHNDDTKGPPV